MASPPIIGLSGVLLTVRIKISLIVLVPSETVTFTFMVPTPALFGVPLKVLVAGSKLSHVGRSESSPRVAE